MPLKVQANSWPFDRNLTTSSCSTVIHFVWSSMTMVRCAADGARVAEISASVHFAVVVKLAAESVSKARADGRFHVNLRFDSEKK